MTSSDSITRAEYERIIRRRVRAIDLALTAMLLTLERELVDDAKGLDNMRELVAGIRTRLVARYPFAAGNVGDTRG